MDFVFFDARFLIWKGNYIIRLGGNWETKYGICKQRISKLISRIHTFLVVFFIHIILERKGRKGKNRGLSFRLRLTPEFLISTLV